MTPERWARLKLLFDQALLIGPEARTPFLAAECGGDPDLQRSVLALLDHVTMRGGPADRTAFSTQQMAESVLGGLRAFAPGSVVANRFHVDRFVGEGGMGEVYAAHDLELGEQVALKTIRPELAGDDAVLEQFKREVQLARRVTHRNVARVFELLRHMDDDGGSVVFLSMELLEGVTLESRLRSAGRCSPDEASAIGLQLVAGLDAAHRRGVIHRDFKSANVMLVRDEATPDVPRAVITDFGLAGTLAMFDAGSRFGGTAGTPAYMAPEQVTDGPLGAFTDIYALGVVLFEMLTGRVPFLGATPIETAQMRTRGRAPRARTLVPAVRWHWDRTIAACLELEPASRPEAPEVEARITGRYYRARRTRAAVLAVLAVAVMAAGWYWTQLPHRPVPEAQAVADRARVKLENVTRAGFLEAAADYRRATEIDPVWAQPWADLAYAYAAGANAQQIPTATARVEARKAALEAIRLERNSGRAYGALGWVQSLDYDEWPEAEATLRRAVALNPTDAPVRYWLGVHLRKKGRFEEAEAEDRQALALSRQADPSYWCEVAFLHWTAGRLDRMDAFMKELLVAYPNFGFARFLNARLLKEQGRYDDALTELNFSERLQYSAVTVLAERASIEAHRGNADAARATLDRLTELSGRQPVDTLLIAGVYAKLGQHDTAIAWLERGYAARDSTMLSIATSPVLRPLHGNPRFADLRRRLHFD